jgi:hypothetical protein
MQLEVPAPAAPATTALLLLLGRSSVQKAAAAIGGRLPSSSGRQPRMTAVVLLGQEAGLVLIQLLLLTPERPSCCCKVRLCKCTDRMLLLLLFRTPFLLVWARVVSVCDAARQRAVQHIHLPAKGCCCWVVWRAEPVAAAPGGAVRAAAVAMLAAAGPAVTCQQQHTQHTVCHMDGEAAAAQPKALRKTAVAMQRMRANKARSS